ncbi:MAG: four helix bundle protein [Clostridia bacterium]|nr:four helix bundle protein [Clostridia bacterium]
MMAWQNYKQLNVWNKSMELTDAVYDLIEKMPKTEQFSLAAQLRRAVISVPSNIAEGNGRVSAKEFKQFLSVAKGSVYEVETQLLIGVRRQFLPQADAEIALSLCDDVSRMLTGLIFHLDKKLS